MGFAIIIEKDSEGKVKTQRSSVPLTKELEEKAIALDGYLSKRIPDLENGLVSGKLLDENIPEPESKKTKGNVQLWHALGVGLRAICDKYAITGRRERGWLWEAIEANYATERIIRAARGRTRSHFEYCFRLSRFPIEFAQKLNWSEWVYFFDSRTVREDQRADDWVMSLVSKGEQVGRKEFRRFTELLNKRVQRLDTSVLTQDELFALYDSCWTETKKKLLLEGNISFATVATDSVGSDH